ncbi:MAG: Tad domain-containing protein [Nitrospinae bacterium]|nr:Tad domain-containing protein [Nitrospinota bacterium]
MKIKWKKNSSSYSLAQMGSFSGLLRDERGIVAIVVALLLVVILGFTAMVIDLGWLFVVNSELQNGADAGALAGVVELALSDDSTAENTAITYATELSQYRLNNPAPKADAVTVTIGGVLGPETLQVEIRRASDTTAGAVPTIFARAWGKDTMTTDVIAIARLCHNVIGMGPGPLLPFGIRDTLIDADGDGNHDIGDTVSVYPWDNSEANWGVLNLNGGAFSNDEVVGWISGGYDDSFVIPKPPGHINVPGDPGISGNSLNAALRLRINDTIVLPVFDKVAGPGGNSIYRVVDFVGGIIRDLKTTGAPKTRFIKFEISPYSSSNIYLDKGSCQSILNGNSTVSKPVLIR